MTFTVPAKTTVIITARRLDGSIQPTGLLIGEANRISYDYQALGDGGVVLERTNITPWKRIVSPQGVQVEVEAADVGDEATEMQFQTSFRLFVRESLVFRDCADIPPG